MYQQLSDADLLVHFRDATHSQRKEILTALYERYKLLVLKLCYYHLGDYDLANDAFHDVFVKVIENAQTIKNPAIFKSWLMTITRNLCVDRLRRSSYLKEQDPDDAEIEVSCEDRVEDRYVAELDRQKILECLRTCLKNMSPVHLSIFKLRWSGFRAAQILKIQKIDKATLRRAYDGIKDFLESCMKKKGFQISIDQILLLGELDD